MWFFYLTPLKAHNEHATRKVLLLLRKSFHSLQIDFLKKGFLVIIPFVNVQRVFKKWCPIELFIANNALTK